MELFLDTASKKELEAILSWGVISGVTTNQKLFLAEKGANFRARTMEIVGLMDGPVSVELTNLQFDAMVPEAIEYYSWAPDKIVIKVPMLGDGTGVRTIAALTRRGIPVNVTTLMSTNQVLLASLAGARYVSIFFNRIKDANEDPVRVIQESRALIDREKLRARIIVGSIRKPEDVRDAALAGAHIVTVPYKFFAQMTYHLKTEETIQEFDRAWKEFKEAEVLAPSR